MTGKRLVELATYLCPLAGLFTAGLFTCVQLSENSRNIRVLAWEVLFFSYVIVVHTFCFYKKILSI